MLVVVFGFDVWRLPSRLVFVLPVDWVAAVSDADDERLPVVRHDRGRQPLLVNRRLVDELLVLVFHEGRKAYLAKYSRHHITTKYHTDEKKGERVGWGSRGGGAILDTSKYFTYLVLVYILHLMVEQPGRALSLSTRSTGSSYS